MYTGPECRAAMNNSQPRTKVGLIDIELNGITKETTICIVYFFGICIVVALKKMLTERLRKFIPINFQE